MTAGLMVSAKKRELLYSNLNGAEMKASDKFVRRVAEQLYQ